MRRFLVLLVILAPLNLAAQQGYLWTPAQQKKLDKAAEKIHQLDRQRIAVMAQEQRAYKDFGVTCLKLARQNGWPDGACDLTLQFHPTPPKVEAPKPEEKKQ